MITRTISGTTAPHRRRSRAVAVASVLLALAAVPATAHGQATPVDGAPGDSTPRLLSLGAAARLAASQGALALGGQARAAEARARVTQARSAFFPDLTATAGPSVHTVNSASFGFSFPTAPGQPPLLDPNGEVIGPVRLVDARVRFQQSIFNFASIGRWRAAQAAATASSAEAENAAEQSAANAAAAYLRALRADAQLQAREADSSLAADLVGIARNQLQAGVGVALDVTRAQSQLATTRAQLIAARNERNRASLDLLRALGLPISSRVALADSLTSLGTASLTTDEAAAVQQALRVRPDLRAANAQLAAARRQLAAIRGERLPSIGVAGDDGVNGKNLQHLLNTYEVGLQVSVPIFEGFRREGRIAEQEAVAREVDVRRQDIQRQVAVEVRTALLDIASAQEQVDAARERVRLAEQEVSQARERFAAGVAGSADVVTASLSLTGARMGLVDALTAYQTARVSLARAEGSVTALP